MTAPGVLAQSQQIVRCELIYRPRSIGSSHLSEESETLLVKSSVHFT